MKNSNPLISIIIPTYNEQENIKECLETMINQSYPNMEIIVVDDGSTDKTLQVVSEMKMDNGKLNLERRNHQGPAKARNYAAKVAKGEILVFMDADMSFEKDFLKELVTPIIKGEYKGTFSKEEYVANWKNVWARCWSYNLGLPDQKLIPKDYPDEGLDFRAILKDEFERVGGFDNTGYTDTWTLSKKLGYKPHSVVGAKYYHNNPDNLYEVFVQSRWSAKREYKYGLVGKVLALLRVSLPISVLVGLYKSLAHKEPAFLPFKVIHDLGQFTGILEKILGGKLFK